MVGETLPPRLSPGGGNGKGGDSNSLLPQANDRRACPRKSLPPLKSRNSPKKSAVPPEIYQLKVTLLGTMPPIWRRLLVPADLTLAQLHDVLQSVMGWQDCHMHEFSAGHRHFGKPNPENRLMGMPPVRGSPRNHGSRFPLAASHKASARLWYDSFNDHCISRRGG